MQARPAVTTFLFTDIEGSTRLWQQNPEAMHPALASHDAIVRRAVESNHGDVVKMSGDGVHAAFTDPLQAIKACLELQRAFADPASTQGIALRVRCGLHAGVDQRRDNDFFGNAVNRAARIMSAAHGGQVLLSQVVAGLVGDRLPAGVSLRDLGTVRLRDLAMPEHVYQLAASGLRQDFPALRSLEATPNNLPQQLTSFIGREHEVPAIEKLLAGTRLLTLLGVGGIGKTRLSLQVAADVMDDYPDGVWLVELAPLTDGSLVAQAVASVLGVKEEAGRPVVEALAKYLKERQILLVLDNCEHLVQASAELAKGLLQTGVHLKILATSREHLRIAGETIYQVPPLAVPGKSDAPSPEEATRYEAVRLFVERAAAAQAGFQLSGQNAAAVTDICTHLDGIPLAIELAAARVRTLSVETIDARLGDRFRLLTGGDKTALPRQQTLRALVDWSFDLLSEKEQILFRRLAVFAGGWPLEAAETVCAGGDVNESEVLDLLAELVNKSLVTVTAENGRFGLLETIRQYAEARLLQSGEEDLTRSRHLDFYLALVEKVAPDLLGKEQAAVLQRLDLERENILSAHGWCLRSTGSAERDYRLVFAIKHYWFIRGLLNLGHRVSTEAVTNPVGPTTGSERCKALWVAGQICSFMGHYEEAQKFLRESLSMARALEDPRMVAVALTTLGLASFGQGDRAAARTYAGEALEIAERSGNKRQIASASNALAQLFRWEGNIERAEPLYQRVVALARELEDVELTAVGLLNLAMVAIARRSVGQASESLREVLAIVAETASRSAVQSALDVSVGLACLRRDWGRAARYWGAAEALTDTIGVQRDPADLAFVEPMVAETRRALGSARFGEAEASGRALLFQAAVADAREWLATM